MPEFTTLLLKHTKVWQNFGMAGVRNLEEYKRKIGQDGLAGVEFSRASRLVSSLSKDCSIFPNLSIFAIYLAVLLAQQRFASMFCGIGSNEERLTGHFISEMFFSRDIVVEGIMERLRAISQETTGEASRLAENCAQNISSQVQFAYGDIATDNQEKYTGGDFGLILVRALPGTPVKYVPIRIQAKKANVRGTSDIVQTNNPPDRQLVKLEASECGYYLYYYDKACRAKGSIVPLVQSVAAVRRQKDRLTRVDTFEDSSDFATFILEVIAVRKMEVEVDSLEDAVEVLTGRSSEIPGFLMAVAAGAAPTYSLQKDLDGIIESLGFVAAPVVDDSNDDYRKNENDADDEYVSTFDIK
ncbi:hypothetical protein ACHMW5_04180 [Azospirillum melinis]|uniref:hypothetical protein n=1 Tax=Azospirillum melinis TaxID=328839 RepID=UPI003756C319